MVIVVRRSLRRVEAVSPVITTILMVVVTIIIAAGLYAVVIGLSEDDQKAICEDHAVEKWFELLDFLDPDEMEIDVLDGSPGTMGFHDSASQIILDGVKFITTKTYYWEARLIIGIAINIACEIVDYKSQTYTDEIQDDFVEYIIGIMLEIRFSDDTQYVFVPVEIEVSSATTDPTFFRVVVRNHDEKNDLEDFPPTIGDLTVGREVHIRR